METIKIVRIGGEFMNDDKQVSEYINPYTGNDFNTWYEFEEGKKIFDSLKYQNLLKEEDGILEEFRNSKEELELNVISNYDEGFKPFIYLFSFLIPDHIWHYRKELAKENGYDDDVMGYITDLTKYSWELEIEREILIPKTIVKKYQLKQN